MLIGYHSSHEQFSPSELLRYTQQAETAGFQSIMSSDHFAPWSSRQGNSGFVWAWLGAAMQNTSLPFGSLAIPGGWRLHPAVLAQAIATLAEMFLERLSWIAVGSGEAVNEHIFGNVWPEKTERQNRLKIAVDIMRALWNGQTVTQDEPIKVHKAKLWLLPKTAPKIYGAALSPETAEWMGSWADGLITTRQKTEALTSIITAFKRGGGEGKPILLQMQLSWANTEEQAFQNAWDQWRNCTLSPEMRANLQTTEEFDKACHHCKPEELAKAILISASTEQHLKWLKESASLGFAALYLHNVGRNQEEFIQAFAREVLPRLENS
jgi:coenzyme F420-dependent glucose-6-phosphate dehydrogenase